MRKYLSILCIILSLLFITSITVYAGSPKSTTKPDHTFALTIDSKEIVIKLPKDFPDMSEAYSRTERCWDADLCAATFCLNNEPTHGHVRFFYRNKEIIALGWNNFGDFRWWLYEKGVSTEVDYDKLLKTITQPGKKSKEK